MSSTKFVFFGPIRKIRWLPRPLIGWDIFDFSSETTERNSMRLDRKQDLNVPYRFWFSGQSEKQDDCSGLWLAEIFLTSPLTTLNRIQQNLTESEISTSYTKFVFFRRSLNKNGSTGRSVKKVSHCTWVHNMWPFWPLVIVQPLPYGALKWIISVCQFWFYIACLSNNFLCCLRSIEAHRDHFGICLSVCLSSSHTFLVVKNSYVWQVIQCTCIPGNAATLFISVSLLAVRYNYCVTCKA